MKERLGIALGWHCLRVDELIDCVRHAEAIGIEVAYVDGDVSQMPSRGDADIFDGMTLLTALLARTERICLSSIRLVHHWNAAKLAQAVATQERIAPGRQRLLLSIGGQPSDRRFGLPMPKAAERAAWLGELCEALRALWQGEPVTRHGPHVVLDGAKVMRLAPPPPLEIAAAGPTMLGVAARHADAWNVNVPALPERLDAVGRAFADACDAAGRGPAEIERTLWAFGRPVAAESGSNALRAAYRRWNPWFDDLTDAEVDAALLVGPTSRLAERLASLRETHGISIPVVDLSGLEYDAARRSIDALAELD